MIQKLDKISHFVKIKPNNLQYYFESAPYPWPFEVLPGRVLFSDPDPWSRDAEKRMDATGFPIDRRDDASAEVIWTDQEVVVEF